MKRTAFNLLVWLALLSACSPADQQVLTPTKEASLSPATATYEPAVPDPTATSRPTRTISPSPSLPPEGILAVQFYPPLVLDFDPDQWEDKSEYGYTKMIVNYLQHRELDSCTIGPMGPSGFYPEGMTGKVLGSIEFQVQSDQAASTSQWVSYYFAITAPGGRIVNESGIAHFAVMYIPSQAEGCKAAAEEVLAALRRADNPAQ